MYIIVFTIIILRFPSLQQLFSFKLKFQPNPNRFGTMFTYQYNRSKDPESFFLSTACMKTKQPSLNTQLKDRNGINILNKTNTFRNMITVNCRDYNANFSSG